MQQYCVLQDPDTETETEQDSLPSTKVTFYFCECTDALYCRTKILKLLNLFKKLSQVFIILTPFQKIEVSFPALSLLLLEVLKIVVWLLFLFAVILLVFVCCIKQKQNTVISNGVSQLLHEARFLVFVLSGKTTLNKLYYRLKSG